MYKFFEKSQKFNVEYKVSKLREIKDKELRNIIFYFNEENPEHYFKLTPHAAEELEADKNRYGCAYILNEREGAACAGELRTLYHYITMASKEELNLAQTCIEGIGGQALKESITLTSEQFRYYFERVYGPTPAKWRHVAGDIAWGNAAWMLGDSVGQAFIPDIYTTQAFSGVSYATLFWPLAIGVMVLAKYYRDAVKNIEREYHRPPTAAELSKINTDTFVLGCKVFGAVAGAELGKILALHVANSIGQALISAHGVLNPLGHLIMAGLVGLCAGLLVFGITLIHEYSKDKPTSYGYSQEKRKGHKDIWADAGKLFLATTLAGAAWYGISIIPGLGSVILGTQGNPIGKGVIDGLTCAAKSIITYLAVKFTFFDLYKATQPTDMKDQTYSWKDDKTPYNYMLSSANFSCGSRKEKEAEGSASGYDSYGTGSHSY